MNPIDQLLDRMHECHYFRYRIILAYDGSEFAGWQAQPDQRTVEGTLAQTFKSVFGYAAIFVGASRTDAGVHALGQVVLCRTSLNIEPITLRIALNNVLPPSLHIRYAEKAPTTFHPQHQVFLKTYYYHIFITRPLPFFERYGWHYKYPFDEQILRKALNTFVGKHDFRSFCTGEHHTGGTIRVIHDIKLSYIARYRVYRVTVCAERFLRYMIRRLVGAALAVSSHHAGGIEYTELPMLLAACNPHHALPKAPACGLMLAKIQYK